MVCLRGIELQPHLLLPPTPHPTPTQQQGIAEGLALLIASIAHPCTVHIYSLSSGN